MKCSCNQSDENRQRSHERGDERFCRDTVETPVAERGSAPCPKCGQMIERRTADPMLDALTHLAECGVLELKVV